MTHCFVYDTNNLIREKYGKSYSRKIRSISAGAFDKVCFQRVENPLEFLCDYHGRKIATVLSSHAVSLVNFPFQPSDLVIFGSEARGIPSEIVQQSDVQICIPQHGKTQSLNVSHAVAIVLYE